MSESGLSSWHHTRGAPFRFYARPRKPRPGEAVIAYDIVDRNTEKVVGYASGTEAAKAANGLTRSMNETVTGGG